MDDFKKYLDKTQIDILECVAVGIERGILKEEDLPKIAEFVLSKIDLIKNEYQLEAFLPELSAKWPIFSTIEKVEKADTVAEQDEEAANSALILLKHGKIDKALSLVKNITKK